MMRKRPSWALKWAGEFNLELSVEDFESSGGRDMKDGPLSVSVPTGRQTQSRCL